MNLTGVNTQICPELKTFMWDLCERLIWDLAEESFSYSLKIKRYKEKSKASW